MYGNLQSIGIQTIRRPHWNVICQPASLELGPHNLSVLAAVILQAASAAGSGLRPELFNPFWFGHDQTCPRPGSRRSRASHPGEVSQLILELMACGLFVFLDVF